MTTATLNSDEMLKTMVAEAVKQQTQIRSAVRDITLKALQARELGLSQINNVVRNVTQGVNAGLGNNGDVEKVLADAVAGMDDAKGYVGMNRWVGLGVLADNVVNIGRALNRQAIS